MERGVIDSDFIKLAIVISIRPSGLPSYSAGSRIIEVGDQKRDFDEKPLSSLLDRGANRSLVVPRIKSRAARYV